MSLNLILTSALVKSVRISSCKYSSLGLNSCKYFSTAKTNNSEGRKDDLKNLNLKFKPELISHLERTSLVGFGSGEAVARLEEAIKFASVLYQVNTAGIQPMDSVLENETLYLRDDETGETSRKDILSNAAFTDEDYFVAPPGNIPLEDSKLAQDLIKTKAS